MHRQLKYSVHYKPQRSERGSTIHTVRLGWLLNKTILEVGALCITIGATAWLMFHHPYFAMNDVIITGLDTYATNESQSIIRSYKDDTHFGIPQNTYLGVSPRELASRLRTRIAFDSLVIEKIFPHTLRIRATETPMKMQVRATNGDAFLSADGMLVRWYSASTTAELPSIGGPTIRMDATLEPRGPLQMILSEQDHLIATKIRASGNLPDGERLRTVDMTPGDQTRILLNYGQGTRVLVTGLADITVQLQKAAASIGKVGSGKQIDVRFGDKVFVSTIKDEPSVAQK